MAHFEGELEYLSQRDLRPFGNGNFDLTRDTPAIEPRSVPAQIGNLEFAAAGIAPQPQVFARDLVGAVERQIDPKVVATAPDRYFILYHQIRLRARIVL